MGGRPQAGRCGRSLLGTTMTMQLKDGSLLNRQGWIDGQWVDADGGGVFAVTDPATGAKIIEVADLGAAETRRAIDAAARALPAWRSKTAKERAAVLRRWFDLLVAHTDTGIKTLGELIAKAKAEPGKINWGLASTLGFDHLGAMGHVARDAPAVARRDLAHGVADVQAHAAGHQVARLLVRVRVRGEERALFECELRHEHVLSVIEGLDLYSVDDPVVSVG